MSTDEYSQEMPDEMFMQRAPSVASMSYHQNVDGSASNFPLPIPGSMDNMSILAQQQHQQQHMQQGQQDQRQKRKYTRRKQPEERKKRGPRTKDLNAPRMPLNGYVRFLNANRERIKQECPELSFADVTKKLAAEWSSMTSESKKVYLDEAEKAKEMYMKELHEYQQTESYQEFLSMKQRAKQQQHQQQQMPNMPVATMAHPSPSQSPMLMSSATSMYGSGVSGGGQQQYYHGESGPPQSMHPAGQYAAMYQHHQQQHQQQHQTYPYGMNGDSKMHGGGPSGPYAQQQQYYPSSGHSSVASDYGSVSCSSQYPSRYHASPYGTVPQNGMYMNATSTNDPIERNEQLTHGSVFIGSNSNPMVAVMDKCKSIMDLPIFTEQFLEHNKLREQELRCERARTMELEEENAILSKHVDDMTAATEKLMQEEAKEREINANLTAMWAKLQNNLVEHFQGINLPFSGDTSNSESQCFSPTVNNFEDYVRELDNFRFQALTNGDIHYPVTDSRYATTVQSIESATKKIDAVTF